MHSSFNFQNKKVIIAELIVKLALAIAVDTNMVLSNFE